jgi:nucleoside-diphosphate-sugar epimerase
MVRRPIVLVTGATGAVGPRVVRALCDSGCRVRTLSIDTPDPRLFPDGVQVLTGDITDPLAVKSAMEGVETVIHLAALLHMINPVPSLKEKYKQVNVRGTATVVEAAIQAGLKRILFFSTIAVYANSNGKIITEDSPTHPETFYAQTKLAAERIVLEAKATDGRPIGTVLRLGAVYGSRIKGNYQRLVQSLARGRFIPIGDGCNRRTLIYDEDVAQASVLATQHPSAAGRIFNLSDGQFHRMTEIVATICKALGRKPPGMLLPVGPVRFVARMVEGVAHLIGLRPPIARSTIDKYVEDVAVDSTRIQKELGFQPKYDLLAGWKKTVQEMRQMGNL